MSHTNPQVSGSASFPRRSVLGAVLWLLCFQFFVAEQIARIHVRGLYSMARNSISDLGALHPFGVGSHPATSYSPLHAVMNASFLLQGVLILAGAVLLKPLFPARPLVRAALLLFALSGLSLFTIGLAPEDTDASLHLLAAAVHFVSGSVAMLLLGIALLQINRIAGLLSFASGSLAMSATLLLGLRNTTTWHTLGLQTGTVERTAAYPLPLWLAVTGFLLLVRMRPSRHTPSTC